ASELDRQIDDVLHQTRYTWRMPREAEPDASKGILTRFVDSTVRMIRDGLRAGLRSLDRLFRRIMPAGNPISLGGGSFDSTSLLTLLLLVAVVVAVFVFITMRRSRKSSSSPVAAVGVASVPDLNSDDVAADQLPADSWTRIALELLEKREFR